MSLSGDVLEKIDDLKIKLKWSRFLFGFSIFWGFLGIACVVVGIVGGAFLGGGWGWLALLGFFFGIVGGLIACILGSYNGLGWPWQIQSLIRTMRRTYYAHLEQENLKK